MADRIRDRIRELIPDSDDSFKDDDAPNGGMQLFTWILVAMTITSFGLNMQIVNDTDLHFFGREHIEQIPSSSTGVCSLSFPLLSPHSPVCV